MQPCPVNRTITATGSPPRSSATPCGCTRGSLSSLRDIEDLLAERNVIVPYESIRQWCTTFGLDYARRLRKRRGALGDRWFLDEVTVSIQGKRQYLWRGVDKDVTSWISSCKAAKTSAPPSVSSVNSKKFNSKSPTKIKYRRQSRRFDEGPQRGPQFL